MGFDLSGDRAAWPNLPEKQFVRSNERADAGSRRPSPAGRDGARTTRTSGGAVKMWAVPAGGRDLLDQVTMLVLAPVGSAIPWRELRSLMPTNNMR